VAILFLVFDIEVVFLYPWAIIFKELGIFGVIEVFIFLVILVVGFIYAIKQGVLEWN
jgi:NADH-quinone oxidoreductase subunit A